MGPFQPSWGKIYILVAVDYVSKWVEAMDYAPFMGYTEVLSLVVKKHGWGIFCLNPDDVLPKIVKEFYAQITSPDNAFIYVRGASVLFDKDSINAQDGLSKCPDEHAYFVKTMSLEHLAQVLIDVCVEGTQWSISRNDWYTIDRISLTP
ncbi:hypothetical protein V6Z11_D05G351500 [Gossypium hirsutum]